MMNYIWFFLLLIALVTGMATGAVDQVSKAALDSASAAVNIALGLIGVMTLWLGIMKIAHEAGLVTLLARAIKPVSRRLFPDIPEDHPAIGVERCRVDHLRSRQLGLDLENAAFDETLLVLRRLVLGVF